MISLDTVILLLPELSLVVLAAWVIVASAFQPSRWWVGFCALVMMIVAFALWRQDTALWRDTALAGDVTGQMLSGPLFVDAFGHWGRRLAVGLGLLFLPLSVFATKEEITGEFLGAVVVAFVGLMIVSTAADLVLLLLGLELISIPTYFLLFVGRSDHRGAEAAVKYFFLSVLSSALFLYGISFVYGAAGTLNLIEIHRQLATSPDAIGVRFLPLATVLVLVGLGFKIAAVPFHFYAPDVYQASSNANAGLLAILPKAAGIIALARIGQALVPVDGEWLVRILIVMSIASMTLGNAAALWQSNLRRMLAYSSIAHAGYMLIGLSAAFAAGADSRGVGATLFYLLVYCVASLGAFATLAYLSNDSEECSNLGQLSGLPHRHPFAAAFLAVFMFSLSGIPPLAGFWGKLTLFTAAMPLAETGGMSTWFAVLLVAAALNAAVAAGYYLRVIATMYFGSEEGAGSAPEITYGVSLTPGLTVFACGLIVIVGGLVAGPLIGYSNRAGQSLNGGQEETPQQPVARSVSSAVQTVVLDATAR